METKEGSKVEAKEEKVLSEFHAMDDTFRGKRRRRQKKGMRLVCEACGGAGKVSLSAEKGR